MIIRSISDNEQKKFDGVVLHPLQSYEWGEFRRKTGVKVIRKGIYENERLVGGLQLTIHRIPYLSYTIGYLPKGTIPNQQEIEELIKIGREEKCIFIQLEPNAQEDQLSIRQLADNSQLVPSAYPLFTKYTFILDLTKSEEELLKNMHPKTRYNIKVAQKNGVRIQEDNSNKSFKEYLELTQETTKRQHFYAHTQKYHRLMWETLKSSNTHKEGLTAHLFTATYSPAQNDKPITLTTWILFVFGDTLYYPYGASSSLYRNTMASNLLMWEAIRFGKKLGLKKFDMWGALKPNADKNDPWYGFHRFKEGYGPHLVEFVGSYDLIISPLLYALYKGVNKIRWIILRFRK